ncbi:MAG: DUF6786 family protein [Planctomycetota bacterium]|nr:DUF6786 family protein [Planctomycetota bacterium]
MSKGTYSQETEFLRRHVDLIELTGSGQARVAVAPAYQGRVMTSSLDGETSFGWLNTAFIDSGEDDSAFNNYGGEDRLWLGPEAGQFGLWFAEGEPFDMDHWKTPPALNTGSFELTDQSADMAAMSRWFEVTNYSNTTFCCSVERTIRLLSEADAAGHLGAKIPAGLAMVGFESTNTLTNSDEKAWTRDTGLLSIWILGMFKPLPRGKVIVPFRPGTEADLGTKVTTDYFNPIPPDRCKVGDGHVLFSCDGKLRSKIGISATRAKATLGSYDPDAKVLTIVQFNLPGDAADRPYVNSLWRLQDLAAEAFAGDVVNSYNDGELAPGAGQLGPFYEIETSSPAAELKSGRDLTHVHRTFHFAGNFEALNDLAQKLLGVSLEQCES